MYDYYGTCNYILIHDTDPTSRFQVVVMNDKECSYNATCKRKLKVTVDGKGIYLGQKTKVGEKTIFAVTVDGKVVDLPYSGVPKIKEVITMCFYKNETLQAKRLDNEFC